MPTGTRNEAARTLHAPIVLASVKSSSARGLRSEPTALVAIHSPPAAIMPRAAM